LREQRDADGRVDHRPERQRDRHDFERGQVRRSARDHQRPQRVAADDQRHLRKDERIAACDIEPEQDDDSGEPDREPRCSTGPRLPRASSTRGRMLEMAPIVRFHVPGGFDDRAEAEVIAAQHISLSRSNLRRAVRARDLIHASYQSTLTLDGMAREAGLSRYFFLRLFSAVYGATPHDYLTGVRVDVAKRALAAGASVTETCLEVGFSSLGSFSSLFARRTGLSPRDWQRRARCTIPVPRLVQSAFVPACFLLFHGLGNFGEAQRAGPALPDVSTRRRQ